MKLAFYDPICADGRTVNEYTEKMWFAPLMRYAAAAGISVKQIADPIPEFGWTMICNVHHLNETLVQHFDSNRCAIVGFSCNDSAYLVESIRPFFHRLPLLFTISGVQRTNFSKQSVLRTDMTVGTRDVRYLPDEEWERYDQMYKDGRLLPLPYVPWDRLPDVPVPEVKTPKILFRGGNHFWRFVAYLHALEAGVAHPASGFLTADYFREDMVPQFRYCQKCRDQYRERGNRLIWSDATSVCVCEPTELNEPLSWNNRTPRAFFKLADKFRERYGSMFNMEEVDVALNFRRQTAEEHLRAVADAAFFAEAKWEFSIPMPQRFWEAASVGTVNLLPDRAADQTYFPELIPGSHFMEFQDDFSGDWGAYEIFYQEQRWSWDIVARNAKEVYEKWIRPSDYCTNSNLLAHILTEIERVAS